MWVIQIHVEGLLQSIFIVAEVGNLLEKDIRPNGYYGQSCRIDGQMFLNFVRIYRISLFFQIVHLGSQVASLGGFKRSLQMFLNFVRICRISLFFQIVHLGSQVTSPESFKISLQLVIVRCPALMHEGHMVYVCCTITKLTAGGSKEREQQVCSLQSIISRVLMCLEWRGILYKSLASDANHTKIIAKHGTDEDTHLQTSVSI